MPSISQTIRWMISWQRTKSTPWPNRSAAARPLVRASHRLSSWFHLIAGQLSKSVVRVICDSVCSTSWKASLHVAWSSAQIFSGSCLRWWTDLGCGREMKRDRERNFDMMNLFNLQSDRKSRRLTTNKVACTVYAFSGARFLFCRLLGRVSDEKGNPHKTSK